MTTSDGDRKPREFWITRSGQEEGPFTEVQLRAMWMNGTINGSMLYWREGLEDWTQLSSVSDLLEAPARIESEKIETAARPMTQADMIVMVIACFLIPLVGLIAGPIWMRQPGAKREQGKTLLGCAIAGIVIWFVFTCAMSASASAAAEQRRSDREMNAAVSAFKRELEHSTAETIRLINRP